MRPSWLRVWPPGLAQKRHSKIARYGKSYEDNQKDTRIKSLNDSPSLGFATFVVAGREGVVARYRSCINKSKSIKHGPTMWINLARLLS